MDRLNSLIACNSDIECIYQENKLLRALIENTYEPAMFLLDPSQNFRFVLVNDAVCRHLGLSKEQVHQLTPMDIDPHINIHKLESLFKTQQKSKTVTFESVHQLPGRQPIPVEITSNYFEFQGKPLLIGYFSNISQRKREEKQRSQRQAQEQQLQLEHQYHKVFDKLAYDVYLLDVLKDNTLKVLDINDSAAARIGPNAKSFIGRIMDDIVPAGNQADYQYQKQYCLTTGETLCYEDYFCHEEKRHFDITMTPIKDESGNINRIIVVKRDTTEKIKQEAENLLREQELRALVEHSRDIIIRYDTQLRRTYVNPAYLKLLRINNIEEVKGKTLLEDNRTGLDADELHHKLSEVIHSKESQDIDLNWSENDGTEYYYEVHLIPEFNTHNEVISILCIGRDYSRRRQAELALLKREEEFRSLVENSPDIISRHTVDGRLIYINPKCSKMVDFIPDIMLNTSPLEHPGGEEGQYYNKQIKEVARLGKNIEFELNWTSPSGEKRCYLVSLAPEKNIDGQIVSILAISRDITLTRKIRQELEQSQAQLRELVAHREQTRENERKHIAREVHDELGQRLTALNMEIQTLTVRYNPNSSALKEQLSRIQLHLKETMSFTRNLVSRLRPSSLDMGLIPALEWLIDDFRQRCPNCKCILTLNCDDVEMDEEVSTAIFRIVQESLTNVAKHANASQVHVLLYRSTSLLLLSIRDNGCGFDTARRYKDSFGLVGLTERVLQIQGNLNIQSLPEKGTCIELSVPLSKTGGINDYPFIDH